MPEAPITIMTFRGRTTDAISVLAPRREGGKLIGATRNAGCALVMRSEELGVRAVLAQIVQMVAAARRATWSPAPRQPPAGCCFR
jgi:hypothetical protein